MLLHEKGMQELAVSTAQKREEAADFDRQTALDAMKHAKRPSTLYKPGLSIDGNLWCALWGENLQDGVAGFGKSPEAALLAFDEDWVKELK